MLIEYQAGQAAAKGKKKMVNVRTSEDKAFIPFIGWIPSQQMNWSEPCTLDKDGNP